MLNFLEIIICLKNVKIKEITRGKNYKKIGENQGACSCARSVDHLQSN
jgi:hypothetical protein